MIDKNKIEKEAKELLEMFSKELGKIKGLKEADILRERSFRKEGKGECDKELKNRMLENAKDKNEDFIIAREKSW